MYIDPTLIHWAGVLIIVFAVVLGILARRHQYKEKVKEDIEWAKRGGKKK